jgi:LmbE family N-acetylglucosaminyl deacetylase
VLDGHPQHREANYVTAEALKQTGGRVRVLGYEVWSFAIPNVAVVIDEVMDRKVEALGCFALANKAVNYTWSTKGANMYRSRVLEAGTANYAECFFELPREEYIELVDRVRAVEIRMRP